MHDRGDPILVTYILHGAGSDSEALEMARDICYEQTVETSREIVGEGWILQCIVGTVESIEKRGEGCHQAVIGYNQQIAGGNLTGLLTMLYGNISLKRGIYVESMSMPEDFASSFKGPRFGVSGIRNLTGVTGRPLLAAPLKPMGKSARDLADLCFDLASGGIDIIKDDHGLSDQPFCPFRERVRYCLDAVERAFQKSGKKALYFPSVMGDHREMEERILFAGEQGAAGILLAPLLTGIEHMRSLAEDENLALPIMAHPALMGTFFCDRTHGLSHALLLGQIMRLAGADMVIFPGFSGRFPFTREQCLSISQSLSEPLFSLPRAFPVPAGGLSLSTIPAMKEVFGDDVIFLMGSNLFTHSGSIGESIGRFLSLAG